MLGHCSRWRWDLGDGAGSFPEPIGSVVVVHGLSCSLAHGILVPRPGIESASLALGGRFLTTGPPGESLLLCGLLLTAHTCNFLPRPALWLLKLVAYRHREGNAWKLPTPGAAP